MSNVQKPIVFSLAVTYDVDNAFDSEKFIKMRLRVCHDGNNPKGTHFNIGDIDSKKDGLKNIPVLANVIFDENGEPQFGGHDMDIEKDKVNDNEYRLVYKEIPIGVIPESNNYSIETYNGKNYVCVDAFIWRDYSNYAEDIIRRDKNIKLSMEIDIKDYSLDSDKNIINITDYKYRGITFLNNELITGMENALATTITFSQDDNCKAKMFDMIKELNLSMSMYSQEQKNDKGGYDKMNNEDTQPAASDVKNTENVAAEPAVPVSTTPETPTAYTKTICIPYGDIKCSLYGIIDKSVDPYIISVSDDHFVYVNNNDSKCYQQKYTKNNRDVQFVDTPTEVFSMYVTSDEKTQIEKMRSSYAEMEAELNELREYKLTAEKTLITEQKNEIFAKWDKIIGKETAFEQLKNDCEAFSVEEIETKCKCIFADSNANFSFSVKTDFDSGTVSIPVFGQSAKDENESEYGDLFAKFSVE